MVLIDNELTSLTLYSEFHRIKVLGTPKTSDEHGSKATLVFPFLIYGLFSSLNSLGFVLLCFLQGSFSKYKLVRAWKIQNHLNRGGKNAQCSFYSIYELTTGNVCSKITSKIFVLTLNVEINTACF